MIGPVVLDTGPLVATLNFEDKHHSWVKNRLTEVRPPLLTCEAVISEALFLLHRDGYGAQGLMSLIRLGAVALPSSLSEEFSNIERLLQKYADLPMSLADACLVRLVEQNQGAQVLTFDHHFEIYRGHRDRPISTLMPPSQ